MLIDQKEYFISDLFQLENGGEGVLVYGNQMKLYVPLETSNYNIPGTLCMHNRGLMIRAQDFNKVT